MPQRLSLLTSLLLILGIIGMAFPPFGMLILLAAWANQHSHKAKRRDIYNGAYAAYLDKQELDDCLAVKRLCAMAR